MTATYHEVKEFLDKHPNSGRYTIMEVFDLKEHEARKLLTEIRNEPEPVIDLMKVAVFDLESTNLKGDIGRLICGSIYSWPSGTMTTFRNDEIGPNMADDHQLSVKIRDLLEEHDLVIGWFSKGFDVAILNTRLIKWGERMLSRHLHLDPIWYYRGWRGLNPRSSKLSVVAEFYNLSERKMGVDVDVWARAGAGVKEDIDILCERCESDVRVTAEIAARTIKAGLVKNIQSYP